MNAHSSEVYSDHHRTFSSIPKVIEVIKTPMTISMALPLRLLQYYYQGCNQGGRGWALVDYIPLKNIYLYYTLASITTTNLESAIKVIFPYNYLVGHPLIKTSTVLTTTTNK